MSGELQPSPKRMTKEYKKFARRAEWYVVHEGKTIKEVAESLNYEVSEDTLQQWSIKFKWQEKRKNYDRRPWTVPKMVYDLLYSELIEINQRQIEGDQLNLTDIQKLEKLLKMHKQAGTPFPEQVGNVMRIFIRFIENKTAKGSQDQMAYLSFVRDFVENVEKGFIHLEE